MGANAQTTVPTFTSGQVLTADQQNQSARTGVPVFADSTARDAAFGGTGEKVLAEGQLAYLEDSDVVQYYDGSVWATVGPSADSGLTLVSTTTIGSAVSTVTVSGAFSATYDNYKILITGGAGSAAQASLRIQFGATTSGYYGARWNSFWGATTSVFGTNNQALPPDIGGVGLNGMSGNIDVYSPFLATRTIFTGSFLTPDTNTTVAEFATTGGFVNNATSYTAFTITPNTGTITGGTIRVYGYKN